MYAKSIAVTLLALALSAAAGPHAPRDSFRHHALAARAPAPVPAPVPEPIVIVERAPAASASKRMVRRRSNARRCKVRSSTSSTLSSTTTAAAAVSTIVNVGSDPATVSESFSSETSSVVDSETSTATPTTSEKLSTSATPSSTHTTATPTTTKAATSTHKTTSSTQVTPTKTSSAASSTSTTESFLVGTQTGQGTFYGTGLGACGITNTDTDFIAAVSHLLFDAFPGYDGANPNNNPICNKKVTATYQGKTVSVTITDRCTGCSLTDLDFSPSAFDKLADESVGRISGMTWVWDDL